MAMCAGHGNMIDDGRKYLIWGSNTFDKWVCIGNTRAPVRASLWLTTCIARKYHVGWAWNRDLPRESNQAMSDWFGSLRDVEYIWQMGVYRADISFHHISNFHVLHTWYFLAIQDVEYIWHMGVKCTRHLPRHWDIKTLRH